MDFWLPFDQQISFRFMSASRLLPGKLMFVSGAFERIDEWEKVLKMEKQVKTFSLTFDKPHAFTMELHKLFESCRSFQKQKTGFLENWFKCGFVMHWGFPVLTFISFTTHSNSKNISFTSFNREVKIFFSHSIFWFDIICIPNGLLWSFEQ